MDKNEFVRETRYVVIKISDANKYLMEWDKNILKRILLSILKGRENDGKEDFSCVVVEHDWPEYEKVWGMIEKRVAGSK